MWIALDRPRPFHVFEFGAGTGQLAHDILEYASLLGDELFWSSLWSAGRRSSLFHERHTLIQIEIRIPEDFA